MKTTLLLIVVVFLMSAAAFAQTSGNITVSGTTPEAFSITDTTDGTVTSSIVLGTLTPSNNGTLAQNTAQVRLRSNKAYKVTAQASALNFSNAGSVDGGAALALTDVGFGITNISAAGANVATGHTDTIATGYDVSGGWPTPANGLTPTFGKTLNDITTGVQVLNGTRISARGNLATNNNFVLVTFGAATLPQFFTPNTGFSTTITLTISGN